MANFRDYGFRGKIAKPFNLDKIQIAIQKILNEDPVGAGQ
jgi:hypothetical protein